MRKEDMDGIENDPVIKELGKYLLEEESKESGYLLNPENMRRAIAVFKMANELAKENDWEIINEYSDPKSGAEIILSSQDFFFREKEIPKLQELIGMCDAFEIVSNGEKGTEVGFSVLKVWNKIEKK